MTIHFLWLIIAYMKSHDQQENKKIADCQNDNNRDAFSVKAKKGILIAMWSHFLAPGVRGP